MGMHMLMVAYERLKAMSFWHVFYSAGLFRFQLNFLAWGKQWTFLKIALFSDFRVLWALCISIRAFSCLLGSRIVGKRDKICFWMMFFNESLHIHRTGTYIYVGNEKCGPLGNIQSFVSQLIICLENRVKKLERLMEVGGFVIVGKYNTYT